MCFEGQQCSARELVHNRVVQNTVHGTYNIKIAFFVFSNLV